jgi:hypothetical protein
MPVKLPILQKKHFGILGLVTIIAMLIGASPYLYNAYLDGNENDLQLFEESRLTEEADAAGPYSYVFPLIRKDSKIYFPLTYKSFDTILQPGSPVYIPNFAHPDAGCNWAGVAGQVFDKNGNPVSGYTLVVSGNIGGQAVSVSGVTGAAQAYGVGGYEAQFAGAPFSSSGMLTVFLLNTDLKQIAAPVPLTTYADCQMNLILLNFKTGS